MIKVNLLPEELRRPPHTPRGRFLLIIVAAAMTAGMIAYLGSVGLMILSTGEELTAVKKNIDEMKPAVAEYDALNKQIVDVAERQKLSEDLRKRGVHWSVVLDHLWDILDNEKALYVTALAVLDSQRAKSLLKGPSSKSDVPPFGLLLTVRILSHDTNRVTALRAALAADEKVREAMPVINYVPEIVYVVKDGIPQMEFNIAMIARPPKRATPAPAATPSGGAPTAGAK